VKLSSGILSIALLLLTGCGYSKRDVVGVYHLLVEGQTPQALALELKSDGTYVQTLRFPEHGTPVIRNGKWTMGKWRDGIKSPGNFSATQPYADAEFVFLENGLALEKCPKCQTVPYEVIPLHISAGMMNTALAQDPKGSVAYDK
jgi:hypothetical protein